MLKIFQIIKDFFSTPEPIRPFNVEFSEEEEDEIVDGEIEFERNLNDKKYESDKY